MQIYNYIKIIRKIDKQMIDIARDRDKYIKLSKVFFII